MMNLLFTLLFVSTKWTSLVRCDSIGSVLERGAKLWEGDRLESDNGDYRLYLQSDGNLVGRDSETMSSFWSTGTHGDGVGPYYLKMQSDDNLVLYDSTKDALWSTKTSQDLYSGVYLKLQNDRNIQLLSSSGELVWEAGTSISGGDDDDNDDTVDYSDISVIGTTFEYKGTGDVDIDVPDGAANGDLLVMFVGASDSSPSWPDGNSWEEIIDKPEVDINIKACWKEYDGVDSYTVENSKNTFVSIVVLRGVDTDNPVVDEDGDLNSYTGTWNKYGVAIARSISTVNNGVVIAAYMFDDPHESTIVNDGFTMLVSENGGDDGMAVGVAETDGSDTGEIETIGKGYESGGGNEVAISVSFRPSASSNSKVSGGSSSRNGSGNGSYSDNGANIGIIILCVVLAILFLIIVALICKRKCMNNKMNNHIKHLSKNDVEYVPPSDVTNNTNININTNENTTDGKVY